MSLYGTGRREGILATLLLAVLVAVVQVTAILAAGDAATGAVGDALARAALPALAAATFYRFGRSCSRSRYAAFLGGAAYALSPWFTTIAAIPREQLAAALAPLALEAACRGARPDQRQRWLPWAGLCLALPFVSGATTVAGLAAALAALRLLGGAVHNRRDLGRGGIMLTVGVLLVAALAAVSFVVIDPIAALFANGIAPTSVELLAAHRAPSHGLDAAAFVRLPGPIMLLFAVLGLLRRQRHASNLGWLALAACGAVPAVLQLTWPQSDGFGVAAAAFWLTLVGITVLGSAGLDDFLELPVRRRRALPALLFAVTVATPLLLLGAPAPMREWPLVATLLSVALLLSVWRRLGMLRLKNVLAVVAMFALAMPSVQVLVISAEVLPMFPAMPLGEFAAMRQEANALRPLWHYYGFAAALLWALALALPRRRSTNARPVPARAKAAIIKKARSGDRS